MVDKVARVADYVSIINGRAPHHGSQIVESISKIVNLSGLIIFWLSWRRYNFESRIDSFLWREQDSRIFLMRSYYSCFLGLADLVSPSQSICWSVEVLGKVAFVSWTTAWGTVLTQDCLTEEIYCE